MEVKDMPKLESPFKRELINGFYVVTPKINEGYEWVFEDEKVMCIEKLDGTNVSIIIEDGVIKQIYNRKNFIPFFGGMKHIVEGLLNSHEKGYCKFTDGQYFGELIGPKVNGNPYKLEQHLWIPFSTYAQDYLKYKAWGKYPKDFETISSWFKDNIFSLFLRRRGFNEKPEGVVFTHPDGRMAKLRRDMFDWFKGDSHHRTKQRRKE